MIADIIEIVLLIAILYSVTKKKTVKIKGSDLIKRMRREPGGILR